MSMEKKKWSIKINRFNPKTKRVIVTEIWKTKPLTEDELNKLIKRDLLKDRDKNFCYFYEPR